MDYKEFKEFIDRFYQFVRDKCHRTLDCSRCILNYGSGRCVVSNMSNMTEKQFEMIERYDGTDWSKVPVDTKIYVWGNNSASKIPRYFAGYTDGYVCAWTQGKTSFTIDDPNEFTMWSHAELCEPREGEYNGNI